MLGCISLSADWTLKHGKPADNMLIKFMVNGLIIKGFLGVFQRQMILAVHVKRARQRKGGKTK